MKSSSPSLPNLSNEMEVSTQKKKAIMQDKTSMTNKTFFSHFYMIQVTLIHKYPRVPRETMIQVSIYMFKTAAFN